MMLLSCLSTKCPGNHVKKYGFVELNNRPFQGFHLINTQKHLAIHTVNLFSLQSIGRGNCLGILSLSICLDTNLILSTFNFIFLICELVVGNMKGIRQKLYKFAKGRDIDYTARVWLCILMHPAVLTYFVACMHGY